MPYTWKGKKVLVAGGAGFIGSCLVRQLLKRRALVRVADNLENGSLARLGEAARGIDFVRTDLRTGRNCLAACAGMDIVLNLAGKVAGVAYNRLHHGTMFRDNALIACNLIEAARVKACKRFLLVGSPCASSTAGQGGRDAAAGEPDRNHFGYGWAQRLAEVQAQAYKEEFGMEFAVARLHNVYGPGDHFEADKAHVIPALIKAFDSEAGAVTLWGNGEQQRRFIFVEDAARELLDLTGNRADCVPADVVSREEVSIGKLAALIAELSGSGKRILFDGASKNAAAPRLGGPGPAGRDAGALCRVSLRDGLKKTLRWYADIYKKDGRLRRA